MHSLADFHEKSLRKALVSTKAQQIFFKYLAEDADSPLNIDEEIRSTALEALQTDPGLSLAKCRSFIR